MRLVDTSAWIEYLRNSKSEIGDRVQKLMDAGEALRCNIVVLELINGIPYSQRVKMDRLRDKIPNLTIDDEIWELAFRLATSARAEGITVPMADLLIAACARSYALSIEHNRDAHFDLLSTIPLS